MVQRTFLVVGLGNPEEKYNNTFHNVGFAAADRFARLIDAPFDKGECRAITAHKKTSVGKVIIAKPITYMNLSGESIIELANFYKIKPEETLIVHDELELPMGTVSFKWSGGLGGHNGLRSTKQVFGTADFWRLRFGLTKPTDRDIAAYVLGKFTEDQEIILSQIFPQAATLLAKVLFSKTPEKFLQEWGKKKLAAE